MSFFVLSPEQAPPSRLNSFIAAAREHHFQHDRSLVLDTWRVDLFASQSEDGVQFHQDPSGDFIAALGSLMYDGQASPACLPDLLRDFHPDRFGWQGLLGMHVVLICRQGVLHVFADGLGACSLYADAGGTVVSSSFLAMLELCEPGQFDPQACFEYVCNGAVFGSRTLADGVRRLASNELLVVDGSIRHRQLPSPIRQRSWDPRLPLEEIADAHVTRLDAVFEPLARHYGDRLRVSFSGGFDSRLMLAMLRRHGAKPTLFVYGSPDDEDVRIARLISQAEGLALRQVDKSLAQQRDPEALAEALPYDLFAFDGWKVESDLFDSGVDRQDRLQRHQDGHVPVNGSLGEIYRNFFYMPDGRSSTGAVISTFYSTFDPRMFTGAFDERAYRMALAAAMREALGTDEDSLERWQVEELYPKFRGRFWTGRDAQLNQRFGTMYFPYLEHAAICDTARVPMRHKDLGRLQGRMIARVDERLARYPSDYGFALDGARPLAYRAKTWVSTQRPPALRRLSFRLKHRQAQPRPRALSDEVLGRVIDLEFPIMRSLFRIDRVYSAQQYGLIATIEYLAQRYGLVVDARRG